jgi:hypothetical protein
VPHNYSSATADDYQWHLDKKVPLTLIVTVLGAIASGIWFAGTSLHRIEILERSEALNGLRFDAAASTNQITRERLARIEQLSTDNQDMLRRLIERLK